MSKGLPENFKVRSKAEWMELATNADPMKKGLVSAALRSLGVEPNKYMGMKEAQRVEYILQRQAEAGASDDDAEKAPAKPKAGQAAAPASSGKPAAAATPASGGGGSTAVLEKKVMELQALVIEQGKALAALMVFVKDTQYLVRVFALTNSDVGANVDDAGIREMYGQPLPQGNE